MKMKKKFIIIGIFTIAIIIFLTIFITHKTNFTKPTVSLLDEITLNDSEKELLSVLQDIDYTLKNPKVTDDENEENTNTIDFTITPTEPTSLKKLINNIYEVRKYINEDGNIFFLLDVDVNVQKNNVNKRRIILTNNGVITSMTYEKDDFAEMEDSNIEQNNDSLTYNLGKDFYTALFENLTNKIREIWEEAIKYDNVNYNKILNKI